MKIDVFASAGEVVKAFNGFRQRIGVDSALLRQLRQGVSSLQIAGTQPGGGGERERSGVAQAVATQRTTIGQQPRLWRVARGCGRQQGGDKESASLTKRLPLGRTAITPGLARSTR